MYVYSHVQRREEKKSGWRHVRLVYIEWKGRPIYVILGLIALMMFYFIPRYTGRKNTLG